MSALQLLTWPPDPSEILNYYGPCGARSSCHQLFLKSIALEVSVWGPGAEQTCSKDLISLTLAQVMVTRQSWMNAMPERGVTVLRHCWTVCSVRLEVEICHISFNSSLSVQGPFHWCERTNHRTRVLKNTLFWLQENFSSSFSNSLILHCP